MRAKAEPRYHVSPKRTPASQRSLLPGSSKIHKIRLARLLVESVQCRSHQGTLVRQATAPDAAQLALAIVVPADAPEDYDGRAGRALPVA